MLGPGSLSRLGPLGCHLNLLVTGGFWDCSGGVDAATSLRRR
ncbi:hypothetical protein G155_00018 [Mycobacterium sp. VKM Ac-1817D]|nr:hypothetical protein G155_00018 [Mycobacterium sp. VKM Ac-1817D]